MKKLILMMTCILFLALPVSAEAIQAPVVPESGAEIMPGDTSSFGNALWELVQNAIGTIRPVVKDAGKICAGVIGVTVLLSVLSTFPGTSQLTCELVGAVTIGVLLLKQTNTLVNLGAETVADLSSYGKLLLPVMTAALAAQGGITGSAALYTGTAFFDGLLSSLISKLLIPMIYLFLALAVAQSALNENLLKQIKDFIKWLMVWVLKIILYVFTGYMGITGVVSGTTDAATLKAAKLTISGIVPVVGSILSDASEAVLVSAGVVKNTAGVYGVLAVMAVCIGPFLEIGIQYLILKATAAVCAAFGSKRITGLVGDFSTAMGLLLAMTGSVCLLFLVSLVCFLKGVV